jgi:hypothetical protein
MKRKSTKYLKGTILIETFMFPFNNIEILTKFPQDLMKISRKVLAIIILIYTITIKQLKISPLRLQ